VHFDTLNVQSQPKIVWPQNLIVAKAYVAQLDRSGALGAKRIAAIKAAIAKVEAPGSARKDTNDLKSMGNSLEKDAGSAKSAADASRMHALAAIFKQG
jgi:hypothetical protein